MQSGLCSRSPAHHARPRVHRCGHSWCLALSGIIEQAQSFFNAIQDLDWLIRLSQKVQCQRASGASLEGFFFHLREDPFSAKALIQRDSFVRR